MKTLYAFFAVVTALIVSSEAYSGSADFNKGLRHYRKKDYKTAEKYFKSYIAQTPDPAAYYLLGYADYKLKKYGDANEYFEEAYLIDPNISAKTAHLIKTGEK